VCDLPELIEIEWKVVTVLSAADLFHKVSLFSEHIVVFVLAWHELRNLL